MPRPIDTDALLKEIGELKKSPWYNGENGNYERIVRADAIGVVVDLCIKAAPTLDYAPVRHGEWVDEIEPNAVTASGREVHVFRCSACDFTWANNVIHYFKYCPNCGAKMDAKEDAHV